MTLGWECHKEPLTRRWVSEFFVSRTSLYSCASFPRGSVHLNTVCALIPFDRSVDWLSVAWRSVWPTAVWSLMFVLLCFLWGSSASSRELKQDWVWRASAGLSVFVLGPAHSNPGRHIASRLLRQLLTSWSFPFHSDWPSRPSIVAWTLTPK